MLTFLRFVQPEKAFVPILVICLGRDMFTRLAQSMNSSLAISVIPVKYSNSVNAKIREPLNAVPREVTAAASSYDNSPSPFSSQWSVQMSLALSSWNLIARVLSAGTSSGFTGALGLPVLPPPWLSPPLGCSVSLPSSNPPPGVQATANITTIAKSKNSFFIVI